MHLADSMPEPDVLVARGRDEDLKTRHPITAALAVEVAVTSMALDREKASLYAEAGVERAWTVLASENRIEVYTRVKGGVYQDKQVYAAGETLVCTALLDVQVSVAEWFG